MRKQTNSRPWDVNAKTASTEQISRLEFRTLERHIWARVQHSPLASMWNLQGVSIREVAKRTWSGVYEESLFGRASQLAYSFFSAVFPALIAMSSIMGMIAKSSGSLYFELLKRIGHLVPPAAFSLVINTFSETERASTKGKITLGLLVAVFSASVGISALQDTLNTVYKVTETRSFWMARIEAIGLTILVALIVLSALLVLFAGDFGSNHLTHFLRGGLSVSIRVLAWVAASLLMILSFEVMYYFCPNVPHRTWRWFTPGAS